MKKLIAFAVAAVAAVSVATAQIDLTVGARGIFGIGVGTTLGWGEKENLDLGNSLDFGGAAFAKVPLYKGLGAQVEIGFTYNSYGRKEEGVKYSYSYKAIDIPLLVAYDVKVNNELTITPLFGPKFSIPVGKATGKSGSSEADVDIYNSVLFGIVTGVSASYKVGPGAVVGDIRYNNGVSHFATGKKDDNKYNGGGEFVPRNLQFSVGYQMTLPL